MRSATAAVERQAIRRDDAIGLGPSAPRYHPPWSGKLPDPLEVDRQPVLLTVVASGEAGTAFFRRLRGDIRADRPAQGLATGPRRCRADLGEHYPSRLVRDRIPACRGAGFAQRFQVDVVHPCCVSVQDPQCRSWKSSWRTSRLQAVPLKVHRRFVGSAPSWFRVEGLRRTHVWLGVLAAWPRVSRLARRRQGEAGRIAAQGGRLLRRRPTGGRRLAAAGRWRGERGRPVGVGKGVRSGYARCQRDQRRNR